MQTFKDFEVLVCDDGSTDDTKQIVNKFIDELEIQYFYIENSGSPAAPRNVGLRKATGTYIAFLDSDDCWMEAKLEVSLQSLEQGYDVVYHDCCIFNQTVSQNKDILRTRDLGVDPFRDLLLKGNGIICSSVVLRSSILKKVGFFDENTNCIAAEDYDYWLRIAKNSFKFKKIYGTYAFYRIHDNNISNIITVYHYTYYLKNKYKSYLSKFTFRFPRWILHNYIKYLFIQKSYKFLYYSFILVFCFPFKTFTLLVRHLNKLKLIKY